MASARTLTFTPLYAQIKASILSRIAGGEWGPGSFLPSEIALAEEYGVSKGTAVAVLDADSTLFPFFMLYDAEGHRVYPVSDTDSIEHGGATEKEAAGLNIADGSEVIRIHRVRVLDGKPVINEHVIIPAARFPGFELDLNRLPNTLYEFYYQKFGVMVIKAMEELSAVMPSASDCRYLHGVSGKPLLEVRRKAFDMEGNVVELRLSRIDTTQNHYRIELH